MNKERPHGGSRGVAGNGGRGCLLGMDPPGRADPGGVVCLPLYLTMILAVVLPIEIT